MEKAVIYAHRQIEENRRPAASRMPGWLKRHRDGYRDFLAAAAQRSLEETGIWFLARGARRDKDEQETAAVWGDLLMFGDLESLPGYSEENRRQAIDFWRSWQNLDSGRLYNPLYQDPQNPEDRRDTPGNRDDYCEDNINTKYIPGILSMLGAELPRSCSIGARADGDEDVFDRIWAHAARWESSPAGMFPITAAREVEEGNPDKIPQVEAGMGMLIRGYDKNTGMWRPEPLEGFPWSEYLPSSGFKIMARVCGYVGLENFPEDILKRSIDHLLEHRGELYGEHPAQPRNYGEMMAHRLTLTDYRRDELLDAMEECLLGFRDPALWEDTESSAYCVFGSGLIGMFMHWEDMPMGAFKEWMRFEHGCEMRHRFVAGPYGNWVNVMEKEPAAVFGQADYDPERFSLKARNRTHWTKKITEVIPQQEVALKLSANGQCGVGTCRFTLTDDQVARGASCYLKATWNGAYEVSLNGAPVKKVCYNLPDLPAGWHLPASVAAALRAGENTVDVVLTGPGKDQSPGAPLSEEAPFIRLGVIEWA